MGVTSQVFLALVCFGLANDAHQALTLQVAHQVAAQKFAGDLYRSTIIKFTD
jgi:hypothetical protein